MHGSGLSALVSLAVSLLERVFVWMSVSRLSKVSISPSPSRVYTGWRDLSHRVLCIYLLGKFQPQLFKSCPRSQPGR